MTRKRYQETQDEAAKLREEKERLAKEGMSLPDAISTVLLALAYYERGHPVDWVRLPRHQYLAAKSRLTLEAHGLPAVEETDD